MRLERRTRSCWSSSASRDHSRSSITLGSPASTRRNRCGSVRNPAAATRASRRSSLAPATLMRSRSRSSCLGLIAYTAKPRSRRASTTGPCGTSIATATEPGSPAADHEPIAQGRQARPAVRERPLAHNFASPVEQADLVLCRAPVDASEPAECLISHGPVLSCSTSRHDACRNLYWRSRARLPTGHPSWPACRGTDPRLVLVARVHGWSLPAGRLARSAYTRLDRALPGYRCTDRSAGAEELSGVGERPLSCPWMPIVPFKLNQDRRHHIPRQRRKITNWPAYDASLRQRGAT